MLFDSGEPPPPAARCAGRDSPGRFPRGQPRMGTACGPRWTRARGRLGGLAGRRMLGRAPGRRSVPRRAACLGAACLGRLLRMLRSRCEEPPPPLPHRAPAQRVGHPRRAAPGGGPAVRAAPGARSAQRAARLLEPRVLRAVSWEEPADGPRQREGGVATQQGVLWRHPRRRIGQLSWHPDSILPGSA